jgi:hypothetical protein
LVLPVGYHPAVIAAKAATRPNMSRRDLRPGQAAGVYPGAGRDGDDEGVRGGQSIGTTVIYE